MYVDVKGRMDQLMQDNRRITIDRISWKMNAIHKEIMKELIEDLPENIILFESGNCIKIIKVEGEYKKRRYM